MKAATCVSLVAKPTINLPYGPQEGYQCPHDLNSVEMAALLSSREFSCGLSTPSSYSPARVVHTHGWSGKDVLGCLTPASASCSSCQETFPTKELETKGLPGSADSQPQASTQGSPATPVPALKRPCKRKAATLELQMPPSEVLQLLQAQGDWPPLPKIPRIETEEESDTVKNKKGQAILISDDKVLQPKTQVMPIHIAPQSVLPSSSPSAGPVVSLSLPINGVSSLGHPASTPLLYQAARPPIPSVPSPSLTPSIPTIPISPSALSSDSLPACQARPCVETPPDAKKKDPTDLATALAPGISHLPRPDPLSFNPPSCSRESAGSVCTASHPPVPFSTVPLSPFSRNPPTVFSTSASNTCEDMCWEPSPWPEEMDMDTTPPSEATILSSPTISSGSSLPFAPGYGCMQQRLVANATVPISPLSSKVPCYTPFGNNWYTPRPTTGPKQGVFPAGHPSVCIQLGLVPALPPMAAITPSHAAVDLELMDTTPPSKAVIFHSSPATDKVSNSLPPQAVWGHTTACNHARAIPQSTTPALLSGMQADGHVFRRKPSTSTVAVGLTSLAGQPARGRTTQLRFVGPASPADRGRRHGTKLAYRKKSTCASSIDTPTSGSPLKTMGSGDCSSSSTNFTPSTPSSVRPTVPISGENCGRGMPLQGQRPTPCYYIARRKGKDNGVTVAPIVLKLRSSSAHSGNAV